MLSQKSHPPLPYTLEQWKEALSTVRKTKTGKASKAQYNCSQVVSQLIKGSATGIFTIANPNSHSNRNALILDPSFITREPDYSSLPLQPSLSSSSSSSSTTTELSYVTLGNSYLSYSTTSPGSINNQIIPITDSYAYKNSSGKVVSVHEFKGDVENNLTQYVEFDVADITPKLQKLARTETSGFILVALTLTPIEIIDPAKKNKVRAEMDALTRLNNRKNGGHVILVQYSTDEFQTKYNIPRLIIIDPAGYVGTDIETMFPFVNIDQPELPNNDVFDRNIGCMLINTEARMNISKSSLAAIKKEDDIEAKTSTVNYQAPSTETFSETICPPLESADNRISNQLIDNQLRIYLTEKDKKCISSEEAKITQTLPGSQKRKSPELLTSLSKRIKLKDPKLQDLKRKPKNNNRSLILTKKLALEEKTTNTLEKVLFDILNGSDFSQRYSKSYKSLTKQFSSSRSGTIKKISKRFKLNARILNAELENRDFREVLNDENYTLRNSSLVKLMDYNVKTARFFLAILMASAFYNKNKDQIAPYLAKLSPQAVRKIRNNENDLFDAFIKDQKSDQAEPYLATSSRSKVLPKSVSENFAKIFFSDSFKYQYNIQKNRLSTGRISNSQSRTYEDNVALLYKVLGCPLDIHTALKTNILTFNDFKFLKGKKISACRFVIACLFACNTLPENVLLLEKMFELMKSTPAEKPRSSTPSEAKKSFNSDLSEVMTTPAVRVQLSELEVRVQNDSLQINRFIQNDLSKFGDELQRLKLETPYQGLSYLQPILQEYLSCIHLKNYQKIDNIFSQLQALCNLLENIKQTHVSNPIINEGYEKIRSLGIYLNESKHILQKCIRPGWAPTLFTYPTAATLSSTSSSDLSLSSSSKTLSSLRKGGGST